MYGGPRPFSGINVTDRPPEAVQLCALVVNPDHSVQPESGTCYPLPDVTHVAASVETVCRYGPGEEYPVLATLKTAKLARAEGLSPDESWWYVAEPGNPGSFCWVSHETTELSGDIAALKLVQPPPVPTGGSAIGEALFAEITGITVDAQSRYVTEYTVHNFQENLPGTHIHFFFDSTPPDQVGITGSGIKLMYGGPSPFNGFQVSDRPPEAARLCVLVANPDHSIISGSGNCFDLPEAEPGAISTLTPSGQSPREPNY